MLDVSGSSKTQAENISAAQIRRVGSVVCMVGAQNASSDLGISLTSGGRGVSSKSARVAPAAVGGVLVKSELEKAVPGGRGGSTYIMGRTREGRRQGLQIDGGRSTDSKDVRVQG